LIDANSEQPLWAETYDRDLTDIFAIQTDVAIQLATALQAELTSDERNRLRRGPTSDVEAYQLYVQGRQHILRYTKDGYMRGIALYEEAIARDPRFARAHAGIAMAWADMGEGGLFEPSVAYPRALSEATRALELDPTLADAHAVLGHIRFASEFNWTAAEESFKRALALQPGFADAYDLYGRMCHAQGRFEEALTLLRRAQALDPLAHRSDVGNALLRAGRVDEAIAEAQRLVAGHPDYDRGRALLGWALIHGGRTEEGLASLEKAVVLSPDNSQWLAQYGEALGLSGRMQEARNVLARLVALSATRYVSPYQFAYVHTGLGEHDLAVDWLERAYAERAGAIYGIKGSFLFRPLREHPRFIALVERLQLTTPGFAT
jgi:serine/threonine-protein kinase